MVSIQILPIVNILLFLTLMKFSTVENLIGIIEVDNSTFSLKVNYLKNNNLILSGYLIVKSDFRVENNGIIYILGNNITLNSSFLTYMIGNSKGIYFYQPHNISIINGMLISDIKAFNAYTTKVFYN